MKQDYEFVYRVLTNKKNTRKHYPALTTLLDLFKSKWKENKDTRLYKVYLQSLQTALRVSIF